MSKIQEISARYKETKDLLDVAELGTDEHTALSEKLAAITKEFVSAKLEESRDDDLAGIVGVLLKHKISGNQVHSYFMKNNADYKKLFKDKGKTETATGESTDTRKRVIYEGDIEYAGAGPNLDIHKRIMQLDHHPDKSLVEKAPMKYVATVDGVDTMFSGHGQLLPKAVLLLAMQDAGLGDQPINLTQEVVKNARETVKGLKAGDTAFGGALRMLEEEVAYEVAFND